MARLIEQLKSAALIPLPHHLLSRLALHASRTPWRFTPWLIRSFVRVYRVDMSEALEPDTSRYATFNAFFTRALKPSARPLAGGAAAGGRMVVCPADGTVSCFGSMTAGQILQAKGLDYTAAALLGSAEDATPYVNGSFITVYLSPRDYHRVHMPMHGELQSMTHVPGRLYSVAAHTVNTIPGLFTRNERVVCHYQTAHGKMAVVLVGAINVAAIETVHHGQITPPAGKQLSRYRYTGSESVGAANRELVAGAELGRFNLGSTAIVLMQQRISWAGEIHNGTAVKMGQLLGLV